MNKACDSNQRVKGGVQMAGDGRWLASRQEVGVGRGGALTECRRPIITFLPPTPPGRRSISLTSAALRVDSISAASFAAAYLFMGRSLGGAVATVKLGRNSAQGSKSSILQ